MKLLLAMLALSLAVQGQSVPMGSVAPTGGGGVSVAFQQAANHIFTNGGGGVSMSFTPLVNPSVICGGFGANGTTGLTAVTDTANGAWTAVDSNAQTFANMQVFCVKNTTTSAITVSWTVSAPGGYVVLEEVSNADGSFPASLGNHGNGSQLTGTATDINTSGNVGGSTGDAILVFCWNYYGVTAWVAGGTNPAGMTIPTNGFSVHAGAGNGNVVGAYSVLAGSYAAKVGMNPGASVTTYGTVVGVQIPHI